MLTFKLDYTGQKFLGKVNGHCYKLPFKRNGDHYEFLDVVAPENGNSEDNHIKDLIHDALLYAQKQHMKVVPKGVHVKEYLQEHPEFDGIVYK